MAYTLLNIGKSANRMSRYASTMPYRGEDNRQFSNLLRPESALKIVNYVPDAAGKLIKRKGLMKIFEVAGNNPVSLIMRYTSNQIIFGYATTIAVYNEDTEVITNIKTDFSANDGFDGERYGNYFFVCNGVDKIWRIFTDLTITEVAASPVCRRLAVFGARLVAGGLSTDETAVQYSEVDDGTNPPFTVWNIATDADDGGKVSYRNAGRVNEVVSLGTNIVVFATSGIWAFTITQIDSSGTIKKIDQTVTDNTGLGGYSALVTKDGVYYVNKAGIFNLVSLGQPNIPYSQQAFDISYVLGPDYFGNINFEGSSMAYDPANNALFISCKTGSSTSNNYVIAVNTKSKYKAFSRFSNWTIRTFFLDNDNVIWGASSVSTTIYKCFQGYDDDGAAIGTEYSFELTGYDPNKLHSLEWFSIQSDMSPSTQFTISFDEFNKFGEYDTNVASYTMTVQTALNSALGYGESAYPSGYGSAGGTLSSGLTPVWDSLKPGIRNWQRLRVKISSGDMVGHTLNLFFAQIKEMKMLRKRTITSNS